MSECRDELLQKRSAATANRYRSALSHVFTIAIKEWQWLGRSPLEMVSKPKEKNARVRFLTLDEIKALLQAASHEKRKPLCLIVLMALSTGARKMEILTLKWSDVDMERGVAVTHDTKNSESRTLHLSGPALAELVEYSQYRHPKSKLVFPNRFGDEPVDIQDEFKRALKLAGIQEFHFHDLRHTAASYMAMNGANASDIAEVLGHKSLDMVKRYAHLSKKHTAGVVASMNEKIFSTIYQPQGEQHAEP